MQERIGKNGELERAPATHVGIVDIPTKNGIRAADAITTIFKDLKTRWF